MATNDPILKLASKASVNTLANLLSVATPPNPFEQLRSGAGCASFRRSCHYVLSANRGRFRPSEGKHTAPSSIAVLICWYTSSSMPRFAEADSISSDDLPALSKLPAQKQSRKSNSRFWASKGNCITPFGSPVQNSCGTTPFGPYFFYSARGLASW